MPRFRPMGWSTRLNISDRMMSNLLDIAVSAHGGLDRWNRIRTIGADLAVGGALWAGKGQPGVFENGRYQAETRAQRATLTRFGALNHNVRFSPERLVLETATGDVIETRDNPRAAFAGHVNETPWDRLHAAYFNGYALWTYLMQPFLYTYPGFAVEEIEPWDENGETWRRLKATFPDETVSHTREQISYFGPDGLLRRHDYAVDVLGGAVGAQYVGDYRTVDGIVVPHRRTVYPLDPNNHKLAEPVLVTIEIGKVEFGRS